MRRNVPRVLFALWATVTLWLGAVPPALAALTLVTPNGGELWEVGSEREIQWAGGPGTNVRIELSRDGAATFETLFELTENDGTEIWTVTGPASDLSVVRITSLEDPSVSVESFTEFAIVDQLVGLTVTRPNGGERFAIGSLELITWGAPSGGNVRIELSRDGGLTYQILFSSTANDGAEPWSVSEPTTDEGLLRITHLEDPTATDESDAPFEVTIPPGVTITTPSGGELWEIGTRRDIRWEGTPGGNVRIELSRDGGGTYETLFGNTPNDGVQSWEVAGPVSASSRIRVTLLDDPAVSGASAEDFGIVVTVSTLTVLRPTSSVIWITGSQQLVTWNAPSGGNVRIELSRDGGTVFEVLFGSTPNDGAQVWTVTGPVSSSCVIRVTKTDDEELTDDSDGTFFITGTPGLTVTAPNGGEVWTTGSVQTIHWTGLEGGRVIVELTRDGGATFETLFASTPNDGEQRWVVTGPASPDALVRVTRLSVPLVGDASDSAFEITTQPLAMVAPRLDDTWVIGSQRLVQWSSDPLGEVHVDLSRDRGQTFEPVFERTANDGGQFWTVTGPPTDRAIMRVTALDEVTGFAESEEFSIARGTLGLSHPIGLERWPIGSFQIITWSTTTGGTARIELSRDGGDRWETLFLNTPNDGSELWSVTGPPCTACQLRIASWQDPELEDVSGLFSIFCSPATSTIVPGQVLSGLLLASDCEAPHRPGVPGKLHAFSMPQAGLVTIDLTADTFDAYVLLVGPDGAVIAENDNAGGSTNAHLESIELPAGGPYTIEVTAADAGASGLYRLRLQRFDVTLLSPSGGEVWRLGEQRTISWRSGAPDVPVRIVLVRSDDPGPVVEIVATGVENDGLVTWTVTSPASSHAVMRVCIPYGSTGTELCDESAPFVLRPCGLLETRSCYTGPPGTLGLGECRFGTQRCGSDGVFGTCADQVVPAFDVCGDGVDDDCDGLDLECEPCLEGDGSCDDDDPCSADTCEDGECVHTMPPDVELLDCRALRLGDALDGVSIGCAEVRPAPRARVLRKLDRLLTAVQRATSRIGGAETRRACVRRVEKARRKARRLDRRIQAAVRRGKLCADASALATQRVQELGVTLAVLSSCEDQP